MSPRKNKGMPGMAALARGKDNKSPKMKKNNPSARAATGKVADDASNDNLGNPPYKPRFKDTSDSELDDDDNDTIKQRRSNRMTAKLMEKTKTELVNIFLKQRTQIIGLQERLEKEKIIRNQSKKQVMIFQNWTGEETNYADSITQFCKTFLFPRYKFLKKGWNEYDESKSSLLSLVKRNVGTPEGANFKNIWERVVVQTIRLKYINIKCNLNNEIKDAYKSE
jgi:hypothetical protein